MCLIGVLAQQKSNRYNKDGRHDDPLDSRFGQAHEASAAYPGPGEGADHERRNQPVELPRQRAPGQVDRETGRIDGHGDGGRGPNVGLLAERCRDEKGPSDGPSEADEPAGEARKDPSDDEGLIARRHPPRAARERRDGVGPKKEAEGEP